jgi:hypothetical protein
VKGRSNPLIVAASDFDGDVVARRLDAGSTG